MESSIFVDNAWFCLQLDHGAAYLDSRSFVQKDSNHIETVIFFTMFFAFLLYGMISVTSRPIANQANLCTFWTCCTVVSWKRPFLCIMSNLSTVCLRWCESWLEEFLTQVRKVHWKCHIAGVFAFLFARDIWTNDDTIGTALHMFHGHCSTWDWIVHILDKSNFFVEQTLLPVHNVWIWTHFDHFAHLRGLISSFQRALDNTEAVFFCVCFAFLMCICTEEECCMA